MDEFLDYGRWFLWIHGRPEGSSISRYDTLKQVEKSTGRTPQDLLNGPSIGSEHHYAWEAFCVLKDHTYSEIEAYSRLTGVKLSPWEVDAVIALSRHREAGIQWQPKSDN